MFTITEIDAAKPPNSPISTGDYWNDILKLAERKVKDICRRELESSTYTEKGQTVEVENDEGTHYVYYLKEPTGSKIAYASFITLTLDETTVVEADLVIEADRIVFGGAGEVDVAYPGGFMRETTTAVPALRQAVIEVMHILHAQGQQFGADTRSGGGVSVTIRQDDDIYNHVRVMLAAYVRPQFCTEFVAEIE